MTLEKLQVKGEELHFWYPAAIGVAGALMLVLLAGFTWASASAALVLLAASAILSRRLAGLKESTTARESETAKPATSQLQNICLVSLPLWARQVTSSRRAGDDAVTSLTTLFGTTVKKLESTLSASRHAVGQISGDGGGGVLAALNSSETDLQGVMQTLKSLQQRKGTILAEVSRYADDLRQMAGDVQHIALQVRILSFNAAIEAAHAGKAGQGFGIVAAEMRQLADLSAETGAKMKKKIESVAIIDATLMNIFKEAESTGDADAASIVKADATIRDVLARFKHLTASLSQSVAVMEAEAEEVRGQISDAIVEFQFQDRVSQILAHVVENMNTLCATVKAQADDAIDAEAWLRDMAEKFSTREEFENLSGAAAGKRIAQNRETTFF